MTHDLSQLVEALQQPARQLPGDVVLRLSELHVARQVNPNIELVRTWYVCAYDGHPWPCRERLILDGYEQEL